MVKSPDKGEPNRCVDGVIEHASHRETTPPSVDWDYISHEAHETDAGESTTPGGEEEVVIRKVGASPWEVLDVLSLLQIIVGFLYVSLSGLALWMKLDKRRTMQKIPSYYLLMMHMVEGTAMVVAGLLVRRFAVLCRNVFWLRLATRVLAASLNTAILAWNIVEVFWPTKGGCGSD